MPSFNEIVGTIVTAVLFAVASGHGDLVWKGAAELRHIALVNARADWGCPSLTKGACTSYDPKRYR